MVLTSQLPSPSSVLLATTLIRVQVTPLSYEILRAVLDTASAVNFITSRAIENLNDHRFAQSLSISGVGDAQTQSKGLCRLDLTTLSGGLLLSAQMFYILPVISSNVPSS